MAPVDRATYDATYPFVNEESAGDIDGSGTFDQGDTVMLSALFGRLASASAVDNPSQGNYGGAKYVNTEALP